MTNTTIMTKESFDIALDWANREAWDGSTGHRDHCRAIPQTIRGFVNSTGPCNCDHPGMPIADSFGDCLKVHYVRPVKGHQGDE